MECDDIGADPSQLNIVWSTNTGNNGFQPIVTCYAGQENTFPNTCSDVSFPYYSASRTQNSVGSFTINPTSLVQSNPLAANIVFTSILRCQSMLSSNAAGTVTCPMDLIRKLTFEFI